MLVCKSCPLSWCFPGSLGQFDNKLIEHAFCQVFAVVCGSWFSNLFIVSNASWVIFLHT